MSETVEAPVSQATPEIQAEAKAMGWRPDFKGDADKWVDADEYIERGKLVLPIVKKANADLRQQVTGQAGEIDRLGKLVKAAQESLEAMETLHTEDTKRKVEQARQDLLARLKVAKTEGNVDDEVTITDQLTQIKTAQAEEGKPKPNGEDKPAPVDHTKDPAFLEWCSENEWFGKDTRKTRLAVAIGESLRLEGETRTGKVFFDLVSKELEATLPSEGTARTDKVEGGGRSTARNGSKSWSDLPADAKAAANKFSDKLVGEGRKFKNTAEYQKYYATKYFEEA